MPSTLQHAPIASRRRRRSRRKAVAATVVALALLVPAGIGAADAVGRWWPDTTPQQVDSSPAPLLLAMRDVADYHAATGTFQVLVDVERDTPYLPSAISGERTTLFATGTVDARVDFSALGPESVTVSPDRRAATMVLPTPTLTPAALDPTQSRVVGRERGLAERLGDAFGDNPTDDTVLYQMAADKLDAAAAQSDLMIRAEDNTRAMLTGLAQSLGYESVTVTFAPPATPAP
jgi:Protein of unknown function (DUF4230)